MLNLNTLPKVDPQTHKIVNWLWEVDIANFDTSYPSMVRCSYNPVKPKWWYIIPNNIFLPSGVDRVSHKKLKEKKCLCKKTFLKRRYILPFFLATTGIKQNLTPKFVIYYFPISALLSVANVINYIVHYFFEVFLSIYIILLY